MADQTRGRHLDNCLRCGNAPDGAAGHASHKQTRDKLVGKPAQLIRPNRACDDDIRDSVAPRAAPHSRILGLIRQGRNGINCGLHIICSASHVPAGIKVECNTRPALARRRARAFDPFDGQQRGFQHLHYCGIDVLSAGTFPFNRHGHIVDDHIRKKLRPHIWKGRETCDQQNHKQEICGSAMPGKIRQQPTGRARDVAHH